MLHLRISIWRTWYFR